MEHPIKVTVCQFPEGTSHLTQVWTELKHHVSTFGSDLVLLPELPFSDWLCGEEHPDPDRWRASIEEHEQWLSRLGELGGAVVASTRPIEEDGVFYNEAFIWSVPGGYQAVHRKCYLPDEPGFREARWYQPAPKHFETVETHLGNIGFLVCTELWFTEWARHYARQNIRILLCPRATEGSPEKWLVGGRAAAIMSGAWCLSSNRGGRDRAGNEWAGSGWIIEPMNGIVRAVTGTDTPFITLNIDVATADAAKTHYPRYVKE